MDSITPRVSGGLSAIDNDRCDKLGLREVEVAAIAQLPELYEGTTTSEIIGFVENGMSVARVAESLRLQHDIVELGDSDVPMIGFAVDSIGFTSTDEVDSLVADAGKFLVYGQQLTAAEYEEHLLASIVAGKTDVSAAKSVFHSPADDVLSSLIEAVAKVEAAGDDPLEYLMKQISEIFDGDMLAAFRSCMDDQDRFLRILSGDDTLTYTRSDDSDLPPDLLTGLGAMNISPRDLGLAGSDDPEDEQVEDEYPDSEEVDDVREEDD